VNFPWENRKKIALSQFSSRGRCYLRLFSGTRSGQIYVEFEFDSLVIVGITAACAQAHTHTSHPHSAIAAHPNTDARGNSRGAGATVIYRKTECYIGLKGRIEILHGQTII